MAFTKITASGIGSTETVTLDGLSVINDGSFGGNVSVGGTLTYEDVTNIDSVGLITARAGVVVGSGITLSKDGDIFATGVTTATSFVGDGSALTGVASTENIRTNTNATFLQNVNVSGTSTIGGDVNIADKIVHIGDTDTAIRFPSGNAVSIETAGSERLRIDSTGNMGLGVANPNVLNEAAKFQELTLGGKTEGAAITLKDDNGNVQGGLFTSDATGAMIVRTITNHPLMFRTNNTDIAKFDSSGHLVPGTNNTYDLGTSSLRWRNLYTTDLQLSNEGKSNDVDGTWGNYTIQEGENDLFLINNRSGKKYKFNLTEVS